MLLLMVSGRNPRSLFLETSPGARPLHIIACHQFDEFQKKLPASAQRWLQDARVQARAGTGLLFPSEGGQNEALWIAEDLTSPWSYGGLSQQLPLGIYQLVGEHSEEEQQALCLGFALGSYRFDAYKQKPHTKSQLVWPHLVEPATVLASLDGVFLARDLINTPASDLGPDELRQTAEQIAKRHRGSCTSIRGDALLKKNYPLIHAVGRASSRPPQLIDVRWGDPSHPKLTLVGKGVCFDTGGLDLKSPQNMKLMKKDMGGAAFVLGLAETIMSRKLPVRLRVLVPAVENSVSGNALRPLDVVPSRKGLTVEVGDTDAEGRLVLADALTEAEAEQPDLIVDAATLTGAARIALGASMPAIFCNLTSTWQALEQAATQAEEAIWRLPLHRPYRSRLESSIADLSNIGSDSYGGCITAALFLQEFVGEKPDWIHMDTMGYNLDSNPGRPAGGEALAFFAFERFLLNRYGAGASEAAPATPRELPRRAAATSQRTKKAAPSSRPSTTRTKKTSSTGKTSPPSGRATNTNPRAPRSRKN